MVFEQVGDPTNHSGSINSAINRIKCTERRRNCNLCTHTNNVHIQEISPKNLLQYVLGRRQQIKVVKCIIQITIFTNGIVQGNDDG